MAICVGFWAPDGKAGEVVEGKIYRSDDPAAAHEYLYESITREAPGGASLVSTRYFDAQKKPLVVEESRYENGQINVYTYDQLQTKEKGRIEVKDGKVNYSFESGGSTDTDDETLEENSIVADGIGQILKKHWATIQAGDSVFVRFLFAERQDSIGFKFFKDEERDYNGTPAVQVVMKPSSFIIAALAPSILLTVEKNPPNRLLEMRGRLPIRRALKDPPEKRSDWRAIDGRVVLSYRPLEETAPQESAPKKAKN